MSLRHAARGFELLGRRFETCRPDWVARDHYLALCPSRLGSLCRFSPAQNSVDSVRRGSTLLNCTGPVGRGIICQVMGAVICWSLPPCNRADGEWGVTAPDPAIIGADYADYADVATGRRAAESRIERLRMSLSTPGRSRVARKNSDPGVASKTQIGVGRVGVCLQQLGLGLPE